LNREPENLGLYWSTHILPAVHVPSNSPGFISRQKVGIAGKTRTGLRGSRSARALLAHSYTVTREKVEVISSKNILEAVGST
jgi:hypothetical protein